MEKLVFLIVGDGPAKSSLETLAAQLGVKESVIFTGMVPPEKVQEYYQLGDVFVSASTSETQGLTYIEAAANGLPLLCRKDPCLKGIIEQNENGFEYTDEGEFLSALNFILLNEKWRITAGKRSAQIAEAYGKGAFADAIEKIYISVLEKETVGG